MPRVSLERIKTDINDLHKKGIDTALNAVGYWRQVGERLRQVKEMLDHGTYEQWVETHCTFGVRQASNYVRIAEKWADIQAQIGNGISVLTMQDALGIAKQADTPQGDTSTEPAEVDVPENVISEPADVSHDEPLQGEVIEDEPEPPPQQTSPPKRTPAEELAIQRLKAQKTAEALGRAFDDLEELSSHPMIHAKIVATCQEIIATAKGWK